MISTFADFKDKEDVILKTQKVKSRDILKIKHMPKNSVAVSFYDVHTYLSMEGITQSAAFNHETIMLQDVKKETDAERV